MNIAGILLAAGASRRAGQPKALAMLGGELFAERAVKMLAGAGAGEVVVVVAEPHAGSIRERLSGVRFVHNPEPARGMLCSLQLAIRGLSQGVEAALVALVDHPRVRPATGAALVDAWRRTGCELVRPAFRGRRGHPFLLARAGFEWIVAEPPESTLRAAMSRIASQFDCAVDDPGVLDDLDTPQAIQSAAQSSIVEPPRRS
jgi:molybdenum cofactor cytidylyltransferase